MICHFILYVNNQYISTNFWKLTLATDPQLNLPGMTEFRLNDESVLGLMPSSGIKKLLGEAIQDPNDAMDIPRAEVYLRVSDPELHLERAVKAGGRTLSSFQMRDWGEAAGYISDPDDHVVAFSKG